MRSEGKLRSVFCHCRIVRNKDINRKPDRIRAGTDGPAGWRHYDVTRGCPAVWHAEEDKSVESTISCGRLIQGDGDVHARVSAQAGSAGAGCGEVSGKSSSFLHLIYPQSDHSATSQARSVS
jgi:hypothetical protein